MRRRALAILATMTLGLGLLAAATPASAVEPPDGAAYVALGDSEAAGTGNLPYLDAECLRSARAYPELLGASLGGVASSACAGASTADVLTGQLGDLGPATRLVTLTVGVNDADWQGVLLACATGGDLACAAAVQAAAADLASLPLDIAQLLGAIRQQAPAAQIVVTGYPHLFGDVSGTCTVGAFQGTRVTFSAAEAAAINQAITGVNALIAGGVSLYATSTGDPRVAYVDVTAAFDGHGLCDTGDRWISGLVSGVATFDRSFHLNAAGQQAYAGILAGALAG